MRRRRSGQKTGEIRLAAIVLADQGKFGIAFGGDRRMAETLALQDRREVAPGLVDGVPVAVVRSARVSSGWGSAAHVLFDSQSVWRTQIVSGFAGSVNETQVP